MKRPFAHFPPLAALVFNVLAAGSLAQAGSSGQLSVPSAIVIDTPAPKTTQPRETVVPTLSSGKESRTAAKIAVFISPNSASLVLGGKQKFVANVTGDASNAGIAWDVEKEITTCFIGCSSYYASCSGPCGVVSPTSTTSGLAVIYTAPEKPLSSCGIKCTVDGIFVRATSIANSAVWAQAEIKIVPVSISVSPPKATVEAGSSQRFVAELSKGDATWSLSQYGKPCSPGCGTITPATTASGVAAIFKAPAASPVVPPTIVRATSVADRSESASATVTIACSTAVSVGPDDRADCLLSKMSEDEKIQLVHGGPGALGQGPRGVGAWVQGVPQLDIPDLLMADGSVGAGNNIGPATALPSSIASAAGWDTNAAYNYGKVIGSDLRAHGIGMSLGGNVNLIGREPRDGRTFEGKGEDPILAGKITAAHLKGTQDQYVLGTIKHFAFNDQQTGETQANALIDERAARESDLLAFQIGIADSGVQSVMCSVNLVNGIYSCENSHLLLDTLKGGWGFPGFVFSDALATHAVTDANDGLDEEQPGDGYPMYFYFGQLEQAIAEGKVPMSRLDNMVHRTLRAMYASGLFDHPAAPHPVDIDVDDAIAQQVEEQGAVLLKNDGILPLSGTKLHSIAVIGSHADIGVLSGGGSAQVIPNRGPALNEGMPCPPCWAPVIWDPSSPMKAIASKAPGATVQFADGTDAASAAKLAASSDVAIVFVSQWESEGMDLPGLNFTDVIHSTPIDQDALVEAVAAKNSRTIVVMENGGAQLMPWLGKVAAVLEAWYPGERGGEAIGNILFGDVNPSGKLPITFPASVNDLPRPVIDSPPNSTSTFDVDYNIEGFNVGYKWFDSRKIEPLFPFGFGLSYTTYSISDAKVVSNLATGNPNLQVSFRLTNTGSIAGAEVAQVYLGMPDGTGEPPKRLVGWKKTFLQPGQSQDLIIEVDQDDSSHPLSSWDVKSGSWQVANGQYTVYLGNSSRNAVRAGDFSVGP